MLASGQLAVLVLVFVMSEYKVHVLPQPLVVLLLLAPVTVNKLLSIICWSFAVFDKDFLPVKEMDWLLLVNEIVGLKLKLGPADAPSFGGEMTMSGI